MLEDEGAFARQKNLLFTAVGGQGSGYARYSAAMYFYMQGRLSAEMLEIYRRCCKFDQEDPLQLARHEGLAHQNEDDFHFRRRRA